MLETPVSEADGRSLPEPPAGAEASAAERARRWREENAEQIAYHDERIAREGAFGVAWRSW